MKNFFKHFRKIDLVSFYICLTISICLLITSFFLPPVGEINSSVVAAVGEIFAFATLGTVIHGINRGADLTLKHGNTEVQINKQNENLD